MVDLDANGAASPAPPVHAGPRVLLAEDHPVNLELVELLLAEIGVHVDSVCDGEAAVQRARTGRYDLILLDIHMPRMDGLDACRAIRQLPGQARVPIVAMTASAFDDDREACLAAGMNDFIGKPILAEVFFAAVHRWLAAADRPAM
jgi:two-component system sensor histidine kinase/response regulator